MLPLAPRQHNRDLVFHTSAPLILSVSTINGGPATDQVFSPDQANCAPQLIVPQNHWQIDNAVICVADNCHIAFRFPFAQ